MVSGHSGSWRRSPIIFGGLLNLLGFTELMCGGIGLTGPEKPYLRSFAVSGPYGFEIRLPVNARSENGLPGFLNRPIDRIITC
jgi:hypothetical protein